MGVCETPADETHFDLAVFRSLGGADFGVIVLAVLPDGGDGVANFFVSPPRAQHGAPVMAFLREQAGVQAAVGGQAGARTTSAEGLGGAGKHARPAAAHGTAPA